MKKKWRWLSAFSVLLILLFSTTTVYAGLTSSKLFWQEMEDGNYEYVREFIVDGKNAYCINGTKHVPQVGDEISEWIEVFNDDLRKVLYYGYGGPMDMGHTIVETVNAAQAANGDSVKEIGALSLAKFLQYELPPPEFRVWKVATNGGESQDLAFYTTTMQGYLQIRKIDATTGDPLKDVVFGIYTEEACVNKIGELVTEEDGYSEAMFLREDTYYLKELHAPEGYELDETPIPVQILVERTKTVTIENQLIQDTVPMINKLPETGSGSLALLHAVGAGLIVLCNNNRRKMNEI